MYYVYVYLDPRKIGEYEYGTLKFHNEPFYIGKGKNERDVTHLSKCSSSKPGTYPFYDKLNSLKSKGFSAIIKRLEFFEEEELSLLKEKELISMIGRFPIGPLLNLTDGGIGGDTFSSQSEQRKKEITEKRSNSCKGKNKGKKCPEHQKLFLSNFWKGTKNIEHSERMRTRFEDSTNREIASLGRLKDKTEWDKKIIEYNKKGDIVKIWNNYRELKTAGFDHIFILKQCRKNSKKWKWENE